MSPHLLESGTLRVTPQPFYVTHWMWSPRCHPRGNVPLLSPPCILCGRLSQIQWLFRSPCDSQVQAKALVPLSEGRLLPPSAVNTMISPLSCLLSCHTHRLLTNPWALQKLVLSLALPHHTVQASYPPSLSRKFSHAWETFAEGRGCGSGGGGQLDLL